MSREVILSPAIQRSQTYLAQTYQMLRSAILSGELPPGTRLIESQIAERLQVSRTPVREALQLLQHDSLVYAESKGNLRVVTLSIKAAEELYDCRISLEELSVRLAFQHIGTEELAQIKSMIDQAQKTKQRKQQQLNSYQMLDLDYRFHRLLAQYSRNDWLLVFLDQIFDKMLLLRIQTTQHNPKVLDICLEHQRIYEAISVGDQELAVKRVRDHLVASKARVISTLESMPSLDS